MLPLLVASIVGSMSTYVSRAQASIEEKNSHPVHSDEPARFSASAGRITGLASSIYSLSLGTREGEATNFELPASMMEFHDGGQPAWKLLLGGLSPKQPAGLSAQWNVEGGLTNDCPLCQTGAQQFFLNAFGGAGLGGDAGQLFVLFGLESSAWSEDGNQSLGIPGAIAGGEVEIGVVSAEISTSLSTARSKKKHESELRLSGEITNGTGLVTQASYRTITDEDDESKIFLGLSFDLK